MDTSTRIFHNFLSLVSSRKAFLIVVLVLLLTGISGATTWTTNGSNGWQNTSFDNSIIFNKNKSIISNINTDLFNDGIVDNSYNTDYIGWTTTESDNNFSITHTSSISDLHLYKEISQFNYFEVLINDTSNLSYSKSGIFISNGTTTQNLYIRRNASVLAWVGGDGCSLSQPNSPIYLKINTTDGLNYNMYYKYPGGVYTNPSMCGTTSTIYNVKRIGFAQSNSANPNVYMNISLFTGAYLFNISSSTFWHDSGSGNEIYQIDANATGQTNANFTVFYTNNGTGSWTQLGSPNLTVNTSYNLASLGLTKYQNIDVKVELYGNTTLTPELMQITFFTQAASQAGTNIATTSDLMFLVNTSETWQFRSNLTGTLNWSVNKVNQSNTTDMFNWTVPVIDNHTNNVYEIAVTNGTNNIEWLVSPLSVSNAPEVIDSFVDGIYTGRIMTDIWSRNQLNWTSENIPTVSRLYLNGSQNKDYRLYSSSNVTYGTWDFYMRFPSGGNNAYGDGVGFYYVLPNNSLDLTPQYRWLDSADEHVWIDYIDSSGLRKPITYISEATTGSNVGCISNGTNCQSDGDIGIGNDWHHVRIINDKRTGYHWNWIGLETVDESFIPESQEYMDYISNSSFIGLRTYEDNVAPYSTTDIDFITIYNETYIYPNRTLSIANSTDIIIKGGLDISEPWTIQSLNTTINNQSIFYYDDSTRTGYVNVSNLTFDFATGFKMDGDTLVFNKSDALWTWKSGLWLNITNSTVRSDTVLAFNLFPNTLLRGKSVNLHSGYIDIINSNLSNINNFRFDQNRNWIDHVNISGNSLIFNRTSLDSSFAVGFTTTSSYDWDVILNNNTLKKSPYVTSDSGSSSVFGTGYASPIFFNTNFVGGIGFNYYQGNLSIVNGNMSGITLSNSGSSGDVKVKYYTDINVINSTGSPISNASITITNNIDDTTLNDIESLTSPQNKFSWIDGVGGTVGYHRVATFDNLNDINTFNTGIDGHSLLPTFDNNSIVLMYYTKNATTQINYTYTINVSCNNCSGDGNIYATNSSVTITPDSSWYRPSPNTYQNTTTIILTESLPTYSISGFVNDTPGAAISSVSIVNGTNSTTTNATGYYQITGMSNGTYNFTYSKTGYITGYKEITINGADVTNQNVTLTASFAQREVTVNCPIGWCFLAMNYTNKTLSEIDVFYSTDTVQSRYNETSQKYETHRTGYSPNQNSNVSQKWGYAYYFRTATDVTVNLTANPSISLAAGWNLVGNMALNRTLSALKTSTGGSQASHFNNSLQSWQTSDSETVNVGESFFIYCNPACGLWSG